MWPGQSNDNAAELQTVVERNQLSKNYYLLHPEMEVGIAERLTILYTELHLLEPDIFTSLPTPKSDSPAEPKICLTSPGLKSLQTYIYWPQLRSFSQEPDIDPVDIVSSETGGWMSELNFQGQTVIKLIQVSYTAVMYWY